MRVPLVPVAELANPVNRPGRTVALDADQAQQPHEIVWACTDLTGAKIGLATIRPDGRRR
jgi:hypothetical protein